MTKLKHTNCDFFSNKMVVNFNVFVASMEIGIMCKVNGTLIVTKENKATFKLNANIMEKILEPHEIGSNSG